MEPKNKRHGEKVLYTTLKSNIRNLNSNFDKDINKNSDKDSILDSISQESNKSIPSQTQEKNRSKPNDSLISPKNLDNNISLGESKIKPIQDEQEDNLEEEIPVLLKGGNQIISNIKFDNNLLEQTVFFKLDENSLICNVAKELLFKRALNRIAVSKYITTKRKMYSKINTVIDKNCFQSTKFTKPIENVIDWTEEEITLENDTYLLDPTSSISTANLKYIKMAKAAKQYRELENKKRGPDKVKLLTRKTEKKQKKQLYPTFHHIGKMVLISKEKDEYICENPEHCQLTFLEKRDNKWYLQEDFKTLAKLG